MINSLRGIIQHVGEADIVLEIGGVGLQVAVTHSVLEASPTVGQPLFLYTYLAVRESALNLYGFSTLEQRDLFELLLQVSGIGPRLALAVLSHLSPDVLRSAVVNDQPDVFVRVPGIGRKTAQKIIFHLKDRLVAPLGFVEAPSEIDTEVLSVLTALGYSLVESQAALQSVPADTPEDTEERVKQALKFFSRP